MASGAPTRNRTAARSARFRIHGLVVFRLRRRVEICGVAGSLEKLRRMAAPVQNEVAGLARRSPPLNLSKTASMAPLDAAPLAHRRKRASQIVVTLRDFAGQRDEQAAR